MIVLNVNQDIISILLINNANYVQMMFNTQHIVKNVSIKIIVLNVKKDIILMFTKIDNFVKVHAKQDIFLFYHLFILIIRIYLNSKIKLIMIKRYNLLIQLLQE